MFIPRYIIASSIDELATTTKQELAHGQGTVVDIGTVGSHYIAKVELLGIAPVRRAAYDALPWQQQACYPDLGRYHPVNDIELAAFEKVAGSVQFKKVWW